MMTADQQEQLKAKIQELTDWERKLVSHKTEADVCQRHVNRLEVEIQALLHDDPPMPEVEIPEASLAEEGASLN